MGCSASLRRPNEGKLDFLESDLVPTTMFPLSMYQKSLLKYTWEDLDKKAVKFGNEIFYRLFTEHPEMRTLFPEFFYLHDLEELRQMDRLTGHPKKIVSAIREAIQSLDDADVFIRNLEMLGEKHLENNLRPEYLSALGTAFSRSVQEVLGAAEYTKDVKRAWNDMYNFICKLLKCGLAKRLLADSKRIIVKL